MGAFGVVEKLQALSKMTGLVAEEAAFKARGNAVQE